MKNRPGAQAPIEAGDWWGRQECPPSVATRRASRNPRIVLDHFPRTCNTDPARKDVGYPTTEGRMLITTESKAQNWRAVAVFDDRPDALLYVGRSSTQVRQGYVESYLELLDDEEREHVSAIQMQQWE